MPSRSPHLILASGSLTRAALLKAAKIDFSVEVAKIDEEEIKFSIAAAGGSPQEAAVTLAEMKACAISRKHPHMLVIGADQILDCDGVWFSKPKRRNDAASQLAALSGRRHRLTSAAAAALGGSRIWSTSDEAHLTMRSLNRGDIDHYLDLAGNAVLETVGSYQIEGYGITLFTRVEGEHTTILGLPMLPLLSYLREFDRHDLG